MVWKRNLCCIPLKPHISAICQSLHYSANITGYQTNTQIRSFLHYRRGFFMKIRPILNFSHIFFENSLQFQKLCLPLQPQTRKIGAIAQLVEQRTENPCVPGSIPGGTTRKNFSLLKSSEIQQFRGIFFISVTYKKMQI